MDNVLSLRPWDALVRRARGRSTDLLKRSDLASVVPSLSPLEAYGLVKGLGPADALPVLAHLEPPQIQALLDLEGWHEHRLSVPDLALWLSAFREVSLEAMQAAASSLDLEAMSALLRRRLLIAMKQRDDRSEEDPLPPWVTRPPQDIEPLVETPDGRFIIAARSQDEDESLDELLDEEDRKWILSFVAELYQQEDWETVAGWLRSAAYDLTTNLEEDAYRFRSARLEDLGFPPRESAIEIYGLLDPGPAEPQPSAPTLDFALPVEYVAPLEEGLFLAALQGIDDPGVMRRLEGDLVAVANKALVADGVLPGQSDAVREVLERLRGYIEIALAEGVEPARRLEVGAHRLQAEHPARLFRIGYTLTVREAGRARRILRHPALIDSDAGVGSTGRLGGGEQGVLEGLLLRRPRVSGALEPLVRALKEEAPGGSPPTRPPLDTRAGEERRPFLSLYDLLAVRQVLEELEVFLDRWQGQPPERPTLAEGLNLPPEERTLDIELATAVGQVILHDRYRVVPFTGAELADLADRIATASGPPHFRSDLVERAVDTVGGPAVAGRVQRLAMGLAEQLWPHVGRDVIDPRFVDAVLTVVEST